jgi:hypothetical protein
MGKLFGIVMLIVSVWAVAELTTKGMDGAFGGAFASDDGEVVRPASVPQRAGAAVDHAHEEAANRRDRMLGAN